MKHRVFCFDISQRAIRKQTISAVEQIIKNSYSRKMSSRKKKNLQNMEVENESETESSSDDENDGPHPDAYTGNEEVQIDFEGRAPVDPDCHGIAQLLSRVFLKAHVDCMQMADLIIAQNYVGSVICQCEDDEAGSEADDDMCEEGTIFGITTVINISAKKSSPCIDQLRTYLMEGAEKNATDAVITHFRDVLTNGARKVGLLINERFINIPSQISVPLMENLLLEINTAKNKGMPFDFDYFIIIVKFYLKPAGKGKPAVESFTNEEEEVFCKNAVNSFDFSVAGECDTGLAGDWLEGDATLIPYRKVILFDGKQLPHLVEDIKKFVNGA